MMLPIGTPPSGSTQGGISFKADTPLDQLDWKLGAISADKRRRDARWSECCSEQIFCIHTARTCTDAKPAEHVGSWISVVMYELVVAPQLQ
jgi:hypothetical protein